MNYSRWWSGVFVVCFCNFEKKGMLICFEVGRPSLSHLEQNSKCIAFTNTKNNKKSVSKRRLGDCPKSDFRNNYYFETLETKRIRILNGNLHSTQPISLRTAEYVTRMLGGVRGSPCQFLAGQSTRLPAGVISVLITILLIRHYQQYSKNADVFYCQVFYNLYFL